ncbi:MAG: hypothetical protein FD177_1002 [Desulfovibrionaceae bacterium]|nr:MAG: hypothetical protein FD177_1002 [Desulfovibrionaceae bacterium]
MALKIVTPPAVEPVELSDAKLQLRISSSVDDVLVESRIMPARFWAEHAAGRQFITATWELRLDAWPCGRVVDLPKPPLQEVLSVKCLDQDGTEQTFSSANYVVDTVSTKGRIVLKSEFSWPTLADQPGAVRIQFKAGYGDAAADVPACARHAILLHIQAAHLGDRETFGGYMEAAARLLDPIRVVEIA